MSSPADLIARAEAALEDVTEGPWVVNHDGWACISSGSDSVFHGYFEGSCGDCGDEIHDAASVAISIEDAEFIAAARTLVPELVAALAALEVKVNGLTPLKTGNEDRLALRFADNPVTAFDLFIEQWVGIIFHAHLLDNDDNAGEYVRSKIRALEAENTRLRALLDAAQGERDTAVVRATGGRA